MRRARRLLLAAFISALALATVGCAGDDDDDGGSAGTTATTDSDGADTGPASISAEDQDSDGITIVVSSVTLPGPGYVVVHADVEGLPGAVIGNSDLLSAGESTDVTVTLDEPLAASGTVFAMAHVDFDDNGIYEFGPDAAVDIPATTEDGEVAVVPIVVTIG